MAVSTYDAISTVTLSAATQFVTISNIPQNYTDLVVVVSGSFSALTYMRMRINANDSVTYQYVDFLINSKVLVALLEIKLPQMQQFNTVLILQITHLHCK